MTIIAYILINNNTLYRIIKDFKEIFFVLYGNFFKVFYKTLILNLDLIRNGYPPINVKFADRKRYYDAFDTYYRDGDAGKMIDLIAEYVNARLDEYLFILSIDDK